MMMFASFLAPLLASVLYVIVFQKAGFRGAILAICAGPVLSPLLSFGLLGGYYLGEGATLFVILGSVGLSLAPLLVLAFKTWPPVGIPSPRGDE